MIKFLTLCTLFFLLYLGFSAVGEFDSEILFTVFDYQVESTLFAFITVFIMIQLVLMIILKIVFLIFDIPGLIKRKWHKRKSQQINKKLLSVVAELLMGNKKKSLKMTNTILSELTDNNKDAIHLIMAETEKTFDKKIQYLRKLLDKKNYSVYAAKKLAEVFYNNSHYKQAEECALKAFNEDDTDPELMLILIRIYAALTLWHKLIFIVSNLQRADSKLLKENSTEIAEFYYVAAKSYLESGSDDEAITYLEFAFELKPDYIEALSMFTELATHTNNTATILKILKIAFLAKPCFEIAKTYADSSREPAEVTYNTLAKIVTPANYPALFLTLATYLELVEKINEIKELKLIPYEFVTKN